MSPRSISRAADADCRHLKTLRRHCTTRPAARASRGYAHYYFADTILIRRGAQLGHLFSRIFGAFRKCGSLLLQPRTPRAPRGQLNGGRHSSYREDYFSGTRLVRAPTRFEQAEFLARLHHAFLARRAGPGHVYATPRRGCRRRRPANIFRATMAIFRALEHAASILHDIFANIDVSFTAMRTPSYF